MGTKKRELGPHFSYDLVGWDDEDITYHHHKMTTTQYDRDIRIEFYLGCIA